MAQGLDWIDDHPDATDAEYQAWDDLWIGYLKQYEKVCDLIAGR